jgi:hypothetical protein
VSELTAYHLSVSVNQLALELVTFLDALLWEINRHDEFIEKS